MIDIDIRLVDGIELDRWEEEEWKNKIKIKKQDIIDVI